MLRVTITPELADTLRKIDAVKDAVHAGPVPSLEALDRLEQEFVADHVRHATSLHSYLEAKGLD